MKPLWDFRQVAAFIGVSEHTIRGKVSRGQIPFIKINRSCRFDPDRIEKWLSEQAREPRRDR